MSQRALLRGVAPALAALLFAPACGNDGAAPTGPSPSVQQALHERIVRLEGSGHSEELLKSAEGLFRRRPVQHWFDLDGWNLGRNELRVVWDLNRPDRDQDRTVIRALDFECPQHPLHVMLEYDRELEERGIDLLIVPVMNRAQIWSDRLPDVTSDEQCLGGDLAMPRLLLEMSKAGLDVVDLYPVFAAARAEARSRGEEADIFLKHNPHWTPLGTIIAAEAIADRVRSMEWFRQGRDREGEDFFRKAAELPDAFPRHGNVPEKPEKLQFDCILDEDGEPLHLSDRTSPVLLISDSFGAVYSAEGAGLPNHLHRLLGYRLDRIKVPAGAENTVWQAIARRGDNLEGKKLVIWVFRSQTLVTRELTKIEIFQD